MSDDTNNNTSTTVAAANATDSNSIPAVPTTTSETHVSWVDASCAEETADDGATGERAPVAQASASGDGNGDGNQHIQTNDDTVEVVDNFDNMGLRENLLRGIYAHGFEKPSAIQQRAIVAFSNGRDLIAQAQSGTGKTAAFSVGALQQIDFDAKKKASGRRGGFGSSRSSGGGPVCQVLILAPTRELAQQTKRVVDALGAYLGVKCHACVGGTAVRNDIARLDDGVHIVVGTPGRVFDMINRGRLDASAIRMMILDEADEMLSRGFQDQIKDILQTLSQNMQIGLFSATMPPEALDISENFMRNPLKILVKSDELTLEGIRQYYIALECEEWKIDTLCDLYETISITQCVIFCNSRRKVDFVTEQLRERQHTVSSTHGDMSQTDREVILQEFRSGSSRILVTTDLMARGIDVQQVSLVINYDLPFNLENYIHRIGRSGRFGRKGTAINFVTNADSHTLQELERHYATQIEEMPSDIAEKI